MRFSLKPGLSFIALQIAITIVVTIVLVILSLGLAPDLVFKGPNNDPDPGTMLLILLAPVVSIAAAFLVADRLMPGLCRWAT